MDALTRRRWSNEPKTIHNRCQQGRQRAGQAFPDETHRSTARGIQGERSEGRKAAETSPGNLILNHSQSAAKKSPREPIRGLFCAATKMVAERPMQPTIAADQDC